MERIAAGKFFPNAVRKINWEKPKQKSNKVRFTKYFLKNGETVLVKRERVSKNFLWRYSKPLKYYFLKYSSICHVLKGKELEAISKKWQYEERIEN
jgi:hypothetical protein